MLKPVESQATAPTQIDVLLNWPSLLAGSPKKRFWRCVCIANLWQNNGQREPPWLPVLKRP